jgi:hypothetical protein
MRFSNSNDQNAVFQYMKIYFSHVIYGVMFSLLIYKTILIIIYIIYYKMKASQRFYNSLSNDPDLMIHLKLTNFLFLTVYNNNIIA